MPVACGHPDPAEIERVCRFTEAQARDRHRLVAEQAKGERLGDDLVLFHEQASSDVPRDRRRRVPIVPKPVDLRMEIGKRIPQPRVCSHIRQRGNAEAGADQAVGRIIGLGFDGGVRGARAHRPASRAHQEAET